jgi:acetolactate synthase-1/2/3 large subunit
MKTIETLDIKTKTGHTSTSEQTITGAEAIMRCLLEEEVETIFGYPGGAIMPVYDALYDYMDRINHILVRHEQGAAHAAQGYARVSGKAGVCLVTSGPGATNLVTGIADAMMDSTPMVCIIGQVKDTLLGTDAFQEADVINITSPITKCRGKCKAHGTHTSGGNPPVCLCKVIIACRYHLVLPYICNDCSHAFCFLR